MAGWLEIEGRADRAEFLRRAWPGVIGSILAVGFAPLIPVTAHLQYALLDLLALIALIVAGLVAGAAGVRRLHDLNVSGLAVVTLYVPVINLVTLGLLLMLDGAPAANRYGPPVAVAPRYPQY